MNRLLHEGDCRIHIRVIAVDQVPGDRYDIRLGGSEHFDEMRIILTHPGIVQVRHLGDPEAIKSLRKPFAFNGIGTPLQRGIPPQYPKDQHRKQCQQHDPPLQLLITQQDPSFSIYPDYTREPL